MIDLVVASPRLLFLDLLASVLDERGFESVSAEPDGLAVSVAISRAGLCLVDHRDLDAESLATLIKTVLVAGRGETKVVVISRLGDADSVRMAIGAGASGYVHTSGGIEALIRALERVKAGEVVVTVPRPSARRGRPVDIDVDRLAESLTRRERECLAALVDGIDTPGIAARLAISELTVRSHIQGLLCKLGVHSRLEAASLAVRHELLESWAPAGAAVG